MTDDIDRMIRWVYAGVALVCVLMAVSYALAWVMSQVVGDG